MIIAVDFDGTCVKFAYPKIGADIGAVPVLKRLVKAGHQLILYTMRDGDELTQAAQWFKDNNIELYGVNQNPTQHKWTTSPKVYAQLYIDDAALGIPLIRTKDEKPYVDWEAVEDDLECMDILPLTMIDFCDCKPEEFFDIFN
jgi:hypothetical protein